MADKIIEVLSMDQMVKEIHKKIASEPHIIGPEHITIHIIVCDNINGSAMSAYNGKPEHEENSQKVAIFHLSTKDKKTKKSLFIDSLNDNKGETN